MGSCPSRVVGPTPRLNERPSRGKNTRMILRMRPDTLPGNFSTNADRIVPEVGHAIARWGNHLGQSANAQLFACSVRNISGRSGLPGHTSSM
eukprot:576534-Pyramimonas_sp.AAC.1